MMDRSRTRSLKRPHSDSSLPSSSSSTSKRKSSNATHSHPPFSTTPKFKVIRRNPPPSLLNSPTPPLFEEEEEEERICPSALKLSFADGPTLWELMCNMENKYVRSSDLFKNHPKIGCTMRGILLDWLMDVCEAYNLQRETLYLAIDYLDRYLSVEKNVGKERLQLTGISCLYLASKMEEIYPPKLSVFAYVTDGACSEEEIISTEMCIAISLSWSLTPITPPSWLSIYLQILSELSTQSSTSSSSSTSGLSSNGSPPPPRTSPRRLSLMRGRSSSVSGFIRANYSGLDFVRAMRIIDLASLDPKFVSFKYSLIAASAIYHLKGRVKAVECSGYSWSSLSSCSTWLTPFAQVVRSEDVGEVLPTIPNIPDESRHLVQSHPVSLQMMEKVQLLQLSISNSAKLLSPLPAICNTIPDGLLTPPRSNEKKGRAKNSVG